MEGENNFVSPVDKPDEEGKKLKVFCAWCKKELGEKESLTEGVSAGICPDCHAKLEVQLEAPKGE